MLATLGAFGIGYVLGARAGKERYEQIRVWAGQAARRLEASRPGPVDGREPARQPR